ncbi:MAG: threonine synthase [Candidatus Methanomethylophilus sp.]|jgi:threonine synthase|nr:threonine synthase [Methanomethylophilus sp.]MCI2074425.1 threonine synthase [Methanomethylophilus sp.]MCI2092778.1 threonine synthase [Methanomethylophilus sp.]MEE3400568.1 threonine synthase [Methanomethylophilus sp.]TQS78769.1 MAG: threonine synthase [Methanomethylophilus alvi]
MVEHKVVCWKCGNEVKDPYVNLCPKCGGLLTIRIDLSKASEKNPEDLRQKPLGVWRYADFMPVDEAHKVSIQEGGTPLYKTEALGAAVDVPNAYVKFEGLNPTGSFKDRGMTVGVSHAKELGAKVVGCASTGNTSAALSAYASKAGMKCAVFLPSGKVAMGKLAQALFFGAKVLSVDGNFDDALALARKMADERKLYLLNSINPYRPEGQKSVMFEIWDQLGFEMPDRVILPVGNAANIWAVYKACMELKELGWIDKVPKLTGIQAAGAAPVANAFAEGATEFVPVGSPETVATAIRIGNPVSGQKALKAIYDTKGYCATVTDDEIIAAQQLLGRKEGICVEPASAASVAGLKKLREMGIIEKDETVACICTGNGLKDPDTILANVPKPIPCQNSVEDVERILAQD